MTDPDSDGSVAGLILAGGENSRFDGLPKGSLQWDGESLFERVQAALTSAVDSLHLSIHDDRPAGLPDGITTIEDTYDAIRGPMNGIYSGLCHTQRPLLVVPWDMPGVNAMFLRDLVDTWSSLEEDVLALCVEQGGRLQPFPGIYAPSAIESLKESLEEGEWGMVRWLESEPTHVVNVGEMPGPNPDPSNFKNVNDPEDIRDLDQYL